jgi:hypothetical protein
VLSDIGIDIRLRPKRCSSTRMKVSRLVTAWDCLLRLFLVLWIVRVPLTMLIFGLALLGLTPQAQDLFMEFARTGLWWMLWFLLVLIFVWAMPTHYAARLLLDTDSRFKFSLVPNLGSERCSQISAIWVPRVLGLLTFVAVLIAIWRSHINLPDLHDTDSKASVNRALIEMTALVIVGAVAFFGYMIWRPRNADLPLLRLLKPVNRAIAPFWRKIAPGLETDRGDDEISRNVGRLLLLALFGLFVLTFASGAENVARAFSRAIAVPFILGGWLPFLSYLSGLGRQFRAPLLTLFFVLIAGAAYFLGDNHSVRLVKAEEQAKHPVDTTPLPLERAISLWKKANCSDNSACPRPVIIAAAGGASRAAFFMATVLGYLLDSDVFSHAGLDPERVRNQLFAISGVSGGSVGAVMVTAALAEANGGQHPCKATYVPLWWKDKVTTWRDCLEVLTSGDFLSADFLGFAFNDMLPFSFFRDRAAVLEDSWRDHYDRIIPKPESAPKNWCHGLSCPFYTLRPSSERWVPLLILNGTSEATGGRILTTLLSTTYDLPPATCPTINDDGKCRIFVQTERFHDLLTEQVLPQGWIGWFERFWLRRPEVDDVQLSTAAHNSARFPLISPPGTIRDRRYQRIVDRIVDGGYFENYGALSAKELALAIHAVDRSLSPLVVVISNDPDDLLSPDDDATRTAAPPKALVAKQKAKARIRVGGSEMVTDLVAPIKTITNARTAHGLLSVAALDSALRDALPQQCEGLIQVRVWPESEEKGSGTSKAVSMSWWLSAPVQEHLHQQSEPQQSGDNAPHLTAILKQMTATSICPAH